MEKLGRNKLVIIIISILAGLAIIIFLAFRYIAPFGKIINYRFTSKLPGAQPQTVFSSGQNNLLKIPTQIITTSKSKIQLKLSQGKFESIKAILKFKPNINEVIFGARGNEKDNFYYQPLYRDVFRNLNWAQVKENGFTLWQKENKYQSVHDFVSNPPLDKKLAFYYLNKDKLQELQVSAGNKEDKNAKTAIETPLRGSHSLLIKVDHSPLIFKIAKQDMNGYDGEDKLKITVLKDDKNLAEKTIADDGIVDTNTLKLKQQEEIITLEDIDIGTYQVDLIDESNGADILITKIEVNQPKLIINNFIFPLGNNQTTLWTNIPNLNVITVHDAGLQTVKLDDQYELKIDQRDKQYLFDLRELTGGATNKIYKLESPKNDLMISGDGYFSFSKEAFFLPEIIKGEELNNLSGLDNVDYILTTYTPPQKDGDWFIAQANIDVNKIKIDGDTLYFSLEVPQIAKYGGELEIDYLDISLSDKKAAEKVEKKETTKTVGKNTLVEQGKNWLAEKFDQVKEWVSNTWQKLFKKTPDTITINTINKPAETPSPSPSPKPSPSPSPKEKIATFVKVLNGGAGQGGAGEFAKVLLGAGFTNVTAETADKTDYKNAIIRYREIDEKVAVKLEELLKKDYKTIDKQKIATTSAEIVVIIGEK